MDLHCKLQALYVELQNYNVELVDGLGALNVAASLHEAAAAAVQPDCLLCMWEYHNLVISSTHWSPTALDIDAMKAVCVDFDGGC